MIQQNSDLIVIGGGIIGLSIAWQLARSGATVTLLERDEIARQSSWAAAGMLSPFGENHESGPLLDFGVTSLRAYPKFISELELDNATPPSLNPPGMIRLLMSEDEIAERRHSASLAKQHGFASDWLSSEAVLSIEPEVGKTCLGGVLSPSEVHINPRLLCASIKTAAQNRGVRILPYSEACSFDTQNGDVTGLVCNGAILRAEKYIIATGAWSSKFTTEIGWNIPVFPRKGQMIKVKLPGDAIPFRHSLYTKSLYLVPRDGAVIIGATQEDVGFDITLTDNAAENLCNGAIGIVPALADSRIIDHWMGLRPATADGLPVIGFIPDHPNVYFATGHLRNGILLTPVTAQSVSDEIINGSNMIPPAFRPGRFAKVRA